jgi:hypothetical protein
MVPLTAPLFGSFFLGAYLPQKMDVLPPLERERLLTKLKEAKVALYGPHLRC